jgi:hypothetical protein
VPVPDITSLTTVSPADGSFVSYQYVVDPGVKRLVTAVLVAQPRPVDGEYIT